jgi:hypothetical protein
MLNVSFKIFIKVIANRFTEVANRIIRPSHMAFLPRRYIIEGVLILHETIHELRRKKTKWAHSQTRFQKAYDKINWSFLQQALRMKDFTPQQRKWIECIVSGGSVGIKINDEIGNFFRTKKGLKQGDSLSPVLFNMVANMLAIFISGAVDAEQFKGLVPHLVDGDCRSFNM